jgi:hypothetical protein
MLPLGRRSPLAAASLCLVAAAIVAVAAVVPFGLYLSGTARGAVWRADSEKLARVSAAQAELLSAVLDAQRAVADLEAAVAAETVAVSREEAAARTLLDAARDQRREAVRSVAAMSASLLQRAEAFENETRDAIARVQQHHADESMRFVVKWHAGKRGVLTSPRIKTEVEAAAKYDNVGNLAKKLLMFDGVRWVVMREDGGDQWLQCMSNDAQAQPGACSTADT